MAAVASAEGRDVDVLHTHTQACLLYKCVCCCGTSPDADGRDVDVLPHVCMYVDVLPHALSQSPSFLTI
jgi:hypothetical protein